MRSSEFTAQTVTETRHGYDSWAILPATMALYNKRVVDIVTAASTWDDSTILVCELDAGSPSSKKRIAFLSTSGDGDYYKVGEGSYAHHDQTGANKGYYEIKNIVHIKDGEIVSKANDFGLNVKASVAVFK